MGTLSSLNLGTWVLILGCPPLRGNGTAINNVSPGLLQYAINRFRHPSVRPVGQALLTGPSIHARNAVYTIPILTHITRIIISFTLDIKLYDII